MFVGHTGLIVGFVVRCLNTCIPMKCYSPRNRPSQGTEYDLSHMMNNPSDNETRESNSNSNKKHRSTLWGSNLAPRL